MCVWSYLLGLDAGDLEGHVHAVGQALTLGVGGRDVVGVARGAVARQLAVDCGTTGLTRAKHRTYEGQN